MMHANMILCLDNQTSQKNAEHIIPIKQIVTHIPSSTQIITPQQLMKQRTYPKKNQYVYTTNYLQEVSVKMRGYLYYKKYSNIQKCEEKQENFLEQTQKNHVTA
eukprot:TRINITY_DN14004_c0_g2_i4.p3 TRINITY_DN14004_c0_g2~~TRINITY_DN14004_c0_g2_i4.p3  ORF type:complete len:104 (-),score=3.53 TRINITY_DN14004_c0_g2_i4:617-928(-)